MNELLLSLKNIFGDCSFTNNSLCLIKSSYEIISLSKFFVYDDKLESPVRIARHNESHQLTVVNGNGKEICLVKTDKCLFRNTSHKKCDCILFTEDKFFFVEISEASAGTRNSKRKDAVEQLSATIELLREKSIDFSSKNVKAVICFKSGQTRPTQPSNNSKRAWFQEQYNVRLEEGNEIVF